MPGANSADRISSTSVPVGSARKFLIRSRPNSISMRSATTRSEQTTFGIAYDGRWKNVGEISFGISKARFHKETVDSRCSRRGDALDAVALQCDRSSGDRQVGRALCRLCARPRGERHRAAQRGQPQPAAARDHHRAEGCAACVSTSAKAVKAVVGVFDLSRPYFGFNSANVYQAGGNGSQPRRGIFVIRKPSRRNWTSSPAACCSDPR